MRASLPKPSAVNATDQICKPCAIA